MEREIFLLLGVAHLGAFFTGVACLSYAIAADASARGASGLFWGIAAVVVPFAAPAYVVYRRGLPPRDEPFTRTERWIGAYGIGSFAAFAGAFIVTPPDPVSLVLVGLPLLCLFVPAAGLLCYGSGWRAWLS